MGFLTHYIEHAEHVRNRARLAEALAIVQAAADACGLSEDPAFALAPLREDEQRRLYALLKGAE